MGAIAPGFRADFILLDELKSFRISDVFLNGKRIDLNYSGIDDGINSSSQIGSKVNEMRSDSWINSDATYLPQSTPPPSILQNNTMRIKSLDNPNIFSTPAKPTTSSSQASIQVIGVIPG
jgi:adenine deaminase